MLQASQGNTENRGTEVVHGNFKDANNAEIMKMKEIKKILKNHNLEHIYSDARNS